MPSLCPPKVPLHLNQSPTVYKSSVTHNVEDEMGLLRLPTHSSVKEQFTGSMEVQIVSDKIVFA